MLRCKLCGGNIIVGESKSYGTCDSCGSTMTLPVVKEERLVNMFNRANHYRQQNEFDKAQATYESILSEDGKNAEAYWGVVLSKFGIEYVEDPSTHKRIPTCHRVQSISVLKDLDYQKALENATDEYSRSLYEQEAAVIAQIQKNILEIANKEEPFDVFICYKETDNTGKRTVDSTIAQDIYYQLEREGLKVFFARITLEDKLGSAYEPYIFAALNSAKVMLVVGTKPEHFNAVWVKNEWSRYLTLIKENPKKVLIPAYKDMDAYDLPEEFSHLQSQDMSKIGFLQDLIRGIQKITSAGMAAPVSSQAHTTVIGAQIQTEPLLERAFLCLEDSDWKKADGLLEQVLNVDPKNAQAYMGKLMVVLNISKESLLQENSEPLTGYADYQKALRFANPEQKRIWESYNQAIVDRKEKERIEAERLAQEKRIEEEKLAEQMRIQAEKLAKQRSLEEKKRKDKQKKIYTLAGIVIMLFIIGAVIRNQINVYQSEQAAKIQLQEQLKEEQEKSTPEYALYSRGIDYMSIGNYKDAFSSFKQIKGYKDADEKVNQISEMICQMYQKPYIMTATINDNYIIGLKEDGTFGSLSGELKFAYGDLSTWSNLTAFSFSGNYILGVNKEGRIVENSDPQRRPNLSGWGDVVSIWACGNWGACVNRDGTVAVSDFEGSVNNISPQNDWHDIAALSDGDKLIGLSKDGKVFELEDGDGTIVQHQIAGWNEIVAVTGGRDHTVGLKKDGTVVAIGENTEGQCNVTDWRDIVAIFAKNDYTVGLKKTVLWLQLVKIPMGNARLLTGVILIKFQSNLGIQWV